VEEKPFTSSLNICPEATCIERVGGGWSNSFPSHQHNTLFPSWSGDISCKDDVTIIFCFIHGEDHTKNLQTCPLPMLHATDSIRTEKQKFSNCLYAHWSFSLQRRNPCICKKIIPLHVIFIITDIYQQQTGSKC
jgi:hypothetical protein